jgi:hypothetical protein
MSMVHPLSRPSWDAQGLLITSTLRRNLYRHRSLGERTQRQSTIRLLRDHFPYLGRYKGEAGGTRPRGYRENWPDDGWRNVNAQYDANRLCTLITQTINEWSEGGRDNWKLREVEAVLFMDGY